MFDAPGGHSLGWKFIRPRCSVSGGVSDVQKSGGRGRLSVRLAAYGDFDTFDAPGTGVVISPHGRRQTSWLANRSTASSVRRRISKDPFQSPAV